ncbi:hypothetical protein PSAB6_240083 [Paraburkholderia sabiae]|nr:hypothetical protein PSAB6_240083 [Paraburkholderia sabiae]
MCQPGSLLECFFGPKEICCHEYARTVVQPGRQAPRRQPAPVRGRRLACRGIRASATRPARPSRRCPHARRTGLGWAPRRRRRSVRARRMDALSRRRAERRIHRSAAPGRDTRHARAAAVPQRRALEAGRHRRDAGRFHESAGSARRLRGRQGRPGASEDGVGLVFPRVAVDRRLTHLKPLKRHAKSSLEHAAHGSVRAPLRVESSARDVTRG